MKILKIKLRKNEKESESERASYYREAKKGRRGSSRRDSLSIGN
jgi:hypothetical protein